jgi:flagellin
MSLSILNNISSLTAENALSNTQASLQKTLTQLSTGLRINSGADDAAGLSIANGLQANISALTQSQLNASDGIGMLQTADGALSQVTSLLNRAVTLAQEAASSTLNGSDGSQAQALDTEFQSILNNINSIGSTTEFNGQQVFGASLSVAMSDGTVNGNMSVTKNISGLSATGIGLGGSYGSASMAVTNNANVAAGDTVLVGGVTYKFETSGTISADNGTSAKANEVAIGGTAAQTLQNLADAVNGVASGSGSEYQNDTVANTNVSASGVVGGSELTFTAKNTAANGSAFTVISTGSGMTALNGASALSTPTNTNLLTTNAAQSALTQLTAAINTVAGYRGTVGAGINQIQSLSNVMNTQLQNLQSADNSVMNADIGQTVANMTQYDVLQSTGMAALQQSNQAQQAVLKLVQ